MASSSLAPASDPSSESSPGTPWRRRIDPPAIATAVAALAIYLLHGFDGPLPKDPGLYALSATTVADGNLPYVEVFNRAGPLAHAIPAIGVAAARTLGTDPLLAMRVEFLLLSVATVTMVFIVGRHHWDTGTGLVAASTMASFAGFTTYATGGPREKTAMVLFLVSAIWAAGRRRWAWSGCLVSLATLTWQPAFFSGVAAAAALIVSLDREIQPSIPVTRRLTWLLRFCLGGLGPLAVTLAVYALGGRLRTFIDCFVLVNARYTSQTGPFDKPFTKTLLMGFSYSAGLIGLGLVGIAVAAVVAHRRRDDGGAAMTYTLLAGAIGATVWTLRAFDAWPDLLVVLPFAAWGTALLVRLVAPPGRRSLRAVVSLVVVVLAGAAAWHSWATRSTGLEDQRASVAAVLSPLPSDATVLTIGAPQAAFLAGQPGPGRYLLTGNGIDQYLEATYAGGVEGYVEWLGSQQATVVAVTGQPSWFHSVLQADYRFVGQGPGWRWYVNRQLDPATIHDVRASIARLPLGPMWGDR